MTPSKRPLFPLLLLALALAMPAARAQTEGKAPLNSELNAGLMYQLLVAEISAFDDDPGTAYRLMLDAAQKAQSDQLFERAVEIALRARAGDSALQAAQAWTRASPSNKDATRYLLQILIGLNKLQDTVEPIKRGLAAMEPPQRIAAIGLVPRYFVRAADKKLAARVVEQALAPELNNVVTGPSAYAAVGTMRLLADDNSGALEAARKGAALNRRAEEPIQLALALIDPKLPSAEALVVAYLKVGARPELHMAYVRKLLDMLRLQDADAEVQRLNASTPDYADAWLMRGSLALQEKRLPDARSALERFVQLRQAALHADAADPVSDRGLVQAYLMLAEIAEQDKAPEDAERYLSLIDSPPEAIRVQARRAAILAHQGKLEQARALIRSAPETQPEDARTKISAEAQLLRDNRQFELVFAFLQDAVQRNPADVDLRYDLAMAAEKIDRIDVMEAQLRQVIAEKPDYHHAYNALGYSLADRNLRLPEARALVKKALEFAPDDPFIQDSLGWVEFRSGNLDRALQILQGAYRSRQDAEIAAHLGEVMWSLGMREDARKVWKAGLVQGPDNETLLNTVKRLSPP